MTWRLDKEDGNLADDENVRGLILRSGETSFRARFNATNFRHDPALLFLIAPPSMG